MSRGLRYLSCFLVTAICLIAVTRVEAEELVEETVNDLFAIYNEAQLDDYNLLQEEYLKAVEQLQDAEEIAKANEVHNNLIDEAIEWQTQEKLKINKEISLLLENNNDVKNEIAANFSNDWTMLEQLDKEYKMTTSKINQLLEKYDSYSLSEKRITDYDELDELTSEVAELQKTYKEAANVKVLGKVYGVSYPLNAESVITSEYGNRIDPISGSSIRFHGGIDLRASVGTEVLALFNGQIIGTGYTTAGGYYVNIDHGNGVRSYYCHLSEIKCQEGDKVNQGDVIALSGNTGTRTTGPHLHLALYIDGNSVNPEILFNAEREE